MMNKPCMGLLPSSSSTRCNPAIGMYWSSPSANAESYCGMASPCRLEFFP